VVGLNLSIVNVYFQPFMARSTASLSWAMSSSVVSQELIEELCMDPFGPTFGVDSSTC
jgi:hypothetical protein